MSPESIFVDGAKLEWREAPEFGVYWKLLHYDPESEVRALLIKMEAGSTYRGHSHPEGEQYYVLEGSLEEGGHTIEAGGYAYHPPGSAHRPKTKTGCLVFVTLRKKVAPLTEAECAELRSDG